MKAFKVIIETVALSKEGAVKLAQDAANALPGEMSGCWQHGSVESKIIEADVPDDDSDDPDFALAPPFGPDHPFEISRDQVGL